MLGRFTKDGQLQESIKFPTPASYDEFLSILADNVAKITTKPWKLTAVAAPGQLDRSKGVVKVYGNLKWTNTPLVSDVSKITKTKVLLENDAKLAGLSEARLVKPLPHKVLYVTISTGIGLALIVDGKIVVDYGDAGGTTLFFERDGKSVDWESIASGSAIVKRFNKRASEIHDPHVWKLISHDIALGLIDEYAIVQPDLIIIGGGVGAHFDRFKKPLSEALAAYETPMLKLPKVIGAKNAETAVIYGCYQLMRDEF